MQSTYSFNHALCVTQRKNSSNKKAAVYRGRRCPAGKLKSSSFNENEFSTLNSLGRGPEEYIFILK